MSYRVTHLWAHLQNEERSLLWLARKSGYSRNYLSLLKNGHRESVSDAFAQRIADTLGVPVEALFAPVATCDTTLAAGGAPCRA